MDQSPDVLRVKIRPDFESVNAAFKPLHKLFLSLVYSLADTVTPRLNRLDELDDTADSTNGCKKGDDRGHCWVHPSSASRRALFASRLRTSRRAARPGMKPPTSQPVRMAFWGGITSHTTQNASPVSRGHRPTSSRW